jgi:hypothetical protein
MALILEYWLNLREFLLDSLKFSAILFKEGIANPQDFMGEASHSLMQELIGASSQFLTHFMQIESKVSAIQVKGKL